MRHAHVVVIGGGYVGQLIQHAYKSARLLDWRKTPPTHHLDSRIGPQYLWEPIPDCESEAFSVTTLVDDQPPTPESILAYKKKIGKEHDGGNWGIQFQHKTTGWYSALPVPKIEYGRQVRSVDLANHRLHMADGAVIDYDVLMNTIPMNAFLKLCLIVPPTWSEFKFDPIYMTEVKNANHIDGMILNYLSHPQQLYYRETLVTGRQFFESLKADHSGPETIRIMPGKIHPHPQNEEIMRALMVFNTFCFGRYATWRPDELAHETWKHIIEWKGTV